MNRIRIIKPNEDLKRDITKYWPVSYWMFDDNDLVVSSTNVTQDPFTKDTLVTLTTSMIKFQLYIKAGSCENITKWGY